MDIHLIMQSAGQILYLGLKQTGEYIKFVTDWLKVFFGNMRVPSFPNTIKVFSNVTANKLLFLVIAAYVLVMNVWAFSMYGKDKKHAKTRKRRISENKLMTVSAIGGAVGGLLGMIVFSHKTNHSKFRAGLPVLCAIQLILFSFVLGFLGFWAFF